MFRSDQLSHQSDNELPPSSLTSIGHETCSHARFMADRAPASLRHNSLFAPPTRPQSLRAVSCAEILHAHMPWSRAVPYVLSGGAGQLMEKLVADDAQKKARQGFPVFVIRSDFPYEGHHQRSAGAVNDKDSES